FAHESDRHVLVLADDQTDDQPYPGYEQIAFRPPSEATTDQERIREWGTGMRVRPGAYSANDFDFKNPKKTLCTTARVEHSHPNAQFEVYDYPGKYVEFTEGEQCSRVRIEELQAPHELAWGRADARGICVGCTFELTDFPRADQCKSYLVTASKLTALSDEFASRTPEKPRGPLFNCTFSCVDADQPFRTEQTTPKPIVQGPQTAIVVGPKDEEIYTDQHGRVKVQFHWDRYGAADENSSCWIRVAQAWAGKHWGAIFLPRIGQEVVVDFLEGDPDRPIITGRVYNGLEKPPYELPDDKTKSTVKSNSTKGGEGFNEVRFEDKKGKEQLFLHAQRNLDIRAKNDAFVTVERDRHLVVQQNDHERVEHSRNESIGSDHKEEIGGSHMLRVGKDQQILVKGAHAMLVLGAVDEIFARGHQEFTCGVYGLSGTIIDISAMASIKLTVGGSVLEVNGAGVFATPPIQTGAAPGAPVGPSVPPPLAPARAKEADTGQPGEVDEWEKEPVLPKPYKPGEDKTHWIEIELVDEDGKPVPGEVYRVTLPDGSVAEGTLDKNGRAKLNGIDEGTCVVTFPELDTEAWEPLG
ncbi:MAG TPA: type VI secretion system tip protein TssI/VgrG, partial [Planctomycetota bacterium]|nr:type VI secretion system tip protein TssI/VgrG [Planctomycetota bacterium]